MKIKIGDRVGAIMSSDEKSVKLFGYGVFSGNNIPPKEVNEVLHEMDMPNPKITLDNGKVVWGCECWWGAEEALKNSIAGLEIIEVDIDIERANHK